MFRFFIFIIILFSSFSNLMCIDYHWEIKYVDSILHYPSIAGISKTNICTFNASFDKMRFKITDLNLENWKSFNIDNPKDLYLFDACMTFDNRLFVVADSGYIITNTINNEGWQYRKIFEVSEAITTIAFRDKDYGVVANNGNELYSTSDGGTNWVLMPEQVIDFPANYLIRQARFEGNTLFLTIYDFATKLHYIKMSFDSGITWEKAALIDKVSIYPVSYYQENGKWWLVGRERTGIGDLMYSIIINSDDNGKTWSRQLYEDGGINGGIFSIQFYENSNEGLAVNPFKVYYTSDGGDNWEILVDSLPNPDSLATSKGRIFKINNDMFIIGYNKIYKFVKGGTSVRDYSENNQEVEAFVTKDNILEIKLKDNQPINQIYFYDLEGKIIYQNTEIFNNIFSMNIDNINHSGLMIIGVNSGKNVYVSKLILNR